MRVFVISICVCLMMVFAACQNSEQSSSKDDLLEIKDTTFKSGTGWGYKVYVGNEIYINQPFIPSIPGKRYFKTEDDAHKVALLVVDKIKQHHLPPTISTDELRQLNISIE